MDIEEIVQKEIDYQISSKSNIWNAAIVTIGGTISLLFAKPVPLTALLFFIGYIAVIILVSMYISKRKRIEYLLFIYNKESNNE